MNSTQDDNLVPDSLVLYKIHPARVITTGSKITIELETGDVIKVRDKDIILLHPGPFRSFNELQSPSGDVELAWEILLEASELGEIYSIAELAALIYSTYNPATAWATWLHINDGLYFQGDPTAIFPKTREEVTTTEAARANKAAQNQAWHAFISRVQNGEIEPIADAEFLEDIAALARGERDQSRVLRDLGYSETPETAHTFLLECSYWDTFVNPYPSRFGITTQPPVYPITSLPTEQRTDLTHLEAYAIDDVYNQDPDDAISLDGDRLWVHVADVAALVPPDCPIDLEARGRGATLYLPEGQVPMLPFAMIPQLGLGLQDVSPALSFGMKLNENGEVIDLEITPSWVRVQRTTYADVEKCLADEPFRTLYQITQQYQEKRAKRGALFIDLPEARILVDNGTVEIHPISALNSRDLVREAMLMTGEAAARFAVENSIAFPFASQPPPDYSRLDDDYYQPDSGEDDLAAHFATRRTMQRSLVRIHPSPHSGLGLSVYSRVTSPLRRYLDLVAHQQLRTYLAGQSPLNQGTILELIGGSENISQNVARVESLSKRHWTLVYLMQNPDWQGDAVLVSERDRRGWVIIPEMGFEGPIYLPRTTLPLNSIFPVRARGINLATLEVSFHLAK